MDEGSAVNVSDNTRKPRKTVSKRKQVRKQKRRGEYKPKTLGVADADVAECIFSDDEMRAEFLEHYVPSVQEGQQGITDIIEDSAVLHASCSLTGDLSSPGSASLSSASCSVSESDSSRPESSCSSRPESSCSSRPDSACSFTVPPVVSPSERSAISAHSVVSSCENVVVDFSSSVTSPPQSEGVTVSDLVAFQLEPEEQSSSATSGTAVSDMNVDSPTSVPSTCNTFSTAEDITHKKSSLSPSLKSVEIMLLKFKNELPKGWVPIADQCGMHILYLSISSPKAVQRQVFLHYDGYEAIFIHCHPILPLNKFLDQTLSVKFDEDCVNVFCDRALFIVKRVMQFEVCSGANHLETREVWSCVPETFVDTNPYKELKYKETCRSRHCDWLIGLGKAKRCASCAKVMKSLHQRKKFLLSDKVDPNTPNLYLTQKQAIEKLKQQHENIRKKDKQIAYLQSRMHDILENEGVNIDDDISSDLTNILENSKLTEFQKLFLKEQVSYTQKPDPRSHRWHPHMIRLALHLKMISTSGYEAMREAGIKLPSSRTLYDYSHSINPQEGISQGLVKMVHDDVSKLEKPYQKFHALIFDEMHVSQNLVFRQSDGKLVGFTHLDEVDKELHAFESLINGNVELPPSVLANKVLAFMVKGLTSNVKYVMAVYPCNQLTKDMLYIRTWQVIRVLENAGIKILALVCDGSQVNRAFFKMHTPITKTKSGIVFDTINFCSPELRPLYFISDVSHLIKTIRNCFYNSGEGEKKTRNMTLNGEHIQWKHIVRLYLTYKDKNFRKSYKLNAQNVFPNSYSCMKVSYAAQVLSNTVANDLESQNWPNTRETVRFIRFCNEFFDMLNGAFSTMSARTRNANLAPYENVNDPRFDKLQHFMAYLDGWKAQSQSNFPPEKCAKTMLSYQTLEGIEITLNGFTGAVRYLLDPAVCGAQFIMARVFSQDALELNFSRWRAGQGGSRNPNVKQVLQKQIAVGLQRSMGMRSKKGNVTSEGTSGMKIIEESLPKRRRASRKRKID